MKVFAIMNHLKPEIGLEQARFPIHKDGFHTRLDIAHVKGVIR